MLQKQQKAAKKAWKSSKELGLKACLKNSIEQGKKVRKNSRKDLDKKGAASRNKLCKEVCEKSSKEQGKNVCKKRNKQLSNKVCE